MLHMTERLEQAIAQLKTLSTDKQDAIATLILEELEEEQRWDDSFAHSPNLLAKLAAEAMAEYRSGKTQELDLVLIISDRSDSILTSD
jgi:aspartate/glutamate racemase